MTVLAGPMSPKSKKAGTKSRASKEGLVPDKRGDGGEVAGLDALCELGEVRLHLDPLAPDGLA